MFTAASHIDHDVRWLIPSQCRETTQCMACLLDVLNNTRLSQVQRHMNLNILVTLVRESVITQQILAANQDVCCQLIHLIADLYTDEPCRQTSISLCVAVIHKLQDDTIFEIFMDKFQRQVLDMQSEKKLQFFLSVFGQLCDMSLLYARILLCSEYGTVGQLLSSREFLEEDTTSSVAYLLFHLMKALSTDSQDVLEDLDSFLSKIAQSVVSWLNTAVNKSLQVNCLGLLKECLQFHGMTSELLSVSRKTQQGHSLLMGLKRILVTKDEMLTFTATQCLTSVLENVHGTEHIQEVFDTDLAEFIFELLHTTDVSKLDCVFKCLYKMASHQLFFDKCHAVYGLDSTLLAVQEAQDSNRFLIVEQGLSFLTCLMEGQPDNMPLFMNHSWSKCCEVLNTCLCNEKLTVFLEALRATHAFLSFHFQLFRDRDIILGLFPTRAKHEQSPVNVASISSLLRTATAWTDHHLKLQSPEKEEQLFSILCIMSDIVLEKCRLLRGDAIFCGNTDEQTQDLKAVIKAICSKLILPWVMGHWHYLSDSDRIEKFLACLDFHMSATGEDQTKESANAVTVGLPCHILSLSQQSQISDDTRQLIGHILAGMFLQLAQCVRPKLDLTEETLIVGFSRLNWQEAQPGRKSAEKISSKEEAVVWFCLMYFSCLMGYREWSVIDIHTFLERILERYPDLLSYGMVVTRAFVYLQAMCQMNDVGDSGVWSAEAEHHLIAYLKKCAVSTWFTEDPLVFRWSVLTEMRTANIGINLVEYWLLQQALAHSNTTNMMMITEDMREVLLEVRENYNFLHCLIALLDNQTVAAAARDVLVFCITCLTGPVSDPLYDEAMYENLFIELIHKFEALFVQVAEVNVFLSVNMLPVLCEFLESRLVSSATKALCFKSVYHSVKLVGMSGVGDHDLAWIFKYLSCITNGMYTHDTVTAIPPLMCSERFLEKLENSMGSSEITISAPALHLVSWLAENGYQYQACRPVIVTSDFLLTSLASCKYTISLPVLKLVNAALSSMSAAAPVSGKSIQFIKRQQNFISTRVFTKRELKQVYMYLQQYVVKDESSIRSESVKCMKTMFNIGPDVYHHIHNQPWNSVMLESVLTTRTHKGLTDTELDLCLLFLHNKSQIWTRSATNIFLRGLLSSILQIPQLDKAVTILDQIKQFACIADGGLLTAAEDHLAGHKGKAV